MTSSAAIAPPRSSRLTILTLLLALLLPLLAATGWATLLFFNLAFAADPEATYHQWALLHSPDFLWGWAGLAVFAMAARQTRKIQSAAGQPSPELSAVAGPLLLLGGFIAAVSVAVPDPLARGAMSVAGSACFLPAALLCTLDFLLFFAARGIDVAGLFVLVAIQWLLIWAGADAYIRFHARLQGEPSNIARALLIQLPLLAFIPNLFFGLAIRLLPRWLTLAHLRPRAFLVALPVYNVGLILLFASAVVWPSLAAPGALLLLIAALLFLMGFSFFAAAPQRETSSTVPASPTRPPRRPNLFILLAFLWLLLALAMMILQQTASLLGNTDPSTLGLYLRSPTLTAAARHALAAGFATLLLIAAGQRAMSTLLPPRLATPRLFAATTLLFNAGIAWQLIFQILTLVNTGQSGWAFRLLGISACLECIATVLFALSVIRTLRAANGVLDIPA